MNRLLKWGMIALAGAAMQSCKKTAVVPQVINYEVIGEIPHDPDAFTQGLQLVDGKLYESTGLKGKSSVRLVDRTTGAVIRKRSLPPEVFGEGLVKHGNELWVLTWQDKTVFVLDAETFQTLRTYSYEGEGWGLTTDGKELIMSDGSDRLVYRSFKDFKETKTVHVTAAGRKLKLLNELEFADGSVYANVFTTSRIARIDPKSGEVSGWLDLSALQRSLPASQRIDVLNGIAYDPKTRHFLITGKLWPRLFEIKLNS